MSFRKIQKSDVPVLSRIYHDENAVGCEYNAVSAYLWSSEYDLRIAEYGEAELREADAAERQRAELVVVEAAVCPVAVGA